MAATGYITVVQNGTQQIITLKTTSTMGIGTNGKLYFDCTNDSYMTTSGISSGASNILQQLNIEGNYEGIGNVILGYPNTEIPCAKPRKEPYIYYVD